MQQCSTTYCVCNQTQYADNIQQHLSTSVQLLQQHGRACCVHTVLSHADARDTPHNKAPRVAFSHACIAPLTVQPLWLYGSMHAPKKGEPLAREQPGALYSSFHRCQGNTLHKTRNLCRTQSTGIAIVGRDAVDPAMLGEYCSAIDA